MLMNTRGLTLSRRLLGGALIGLAIVSAGLLSVSPVQAGLSGRMLIAGYGPELHLFQDLGKAFE